MDNLTIYNAVRTVPKTALKEIQAGRLKGKSDINPMWRIKTLTETFGVCGFGWKYVIDEQKLESGANGEIAAFVKISLYVNLDGKWSEAIPGTGGSSFIANESKGLYMSDECFKMALTDAISVACKALGVGADVYWDKDDSKYDKPDTKAETKKESEQAETPKESTAVKLGNMLLEMSYGDKEKAASMLEGYTTFTNAENKVIPGRRTIIGMSDKCILSTYGKVKKDYELWQNEQK